MSDSKKKFRCVNCGAPAAALFKTYGPSVLKLTKCAKCKELVDKYLEYDPVIVMIDVMLLYKEAQRHVLHNTAFKSYWKLFIILMMLETYGVWRNDSLFTVAITTMCGFKNNATIEPWRLGIPVETIEVPDTWKTNCWAWDQNERGDDSDLFIWEKDFYIHFLSTFAGTVIFILVVNNIMRLMKSFVRLHEVSLVNLVKGFSIGNASVLFTLPMLVWGNLDTSPETRAAHYAIVYAYGLAMLSGAYGVLYECPSAHTAPALLAACCARHVASYHATAYLRRLIA